MNEHFRLEIYLARSHNGMKRSGIEVWLGIVTKIFNGRPVFLKKKSRSAFFIKGLHLGMEKNRKIFYNRGTGYF